MPLKTGKNYQFSRTGVVFGEGVFHQIIPFSHCMFRNWRDTRQPIWGFENAPRKDVLINASEVAILSRYFATVWFNQLAVDGGVALIKTDTRHKTDQELGKPRHTDGDSRSSGCEKVIGSFYHEVLKDIIISRLIISTIGEKSNMVFSFLKCVK